MLNRKKFSLEVEPELKTSGTVRCPLPQKIILSRVDPVKDAS
jgi:hypothetical protein